MALAYSYLRFSSPEQAKGDSVRRQTAARDAWLAAHPEVTLDTSLCLTDAGRSGFKRDDFDSYALGQFVACIKDGRVPKGAYLLVENLDRLSREGAGEATELFLSIVNKGIVIVQLSPVVMEFRKPVQLMSLMYAILELSRGHSESALKSERGRAVWSRKQKEASTNLVTKKLPGWIVEKDGVLAINEGKAAVVRRIFAMSIEGHGAGAIASTFNRERVPVLGRALVKGRRVLWANTTVRHILSSRATIGDYVAYKTTGRNKTPGEPVPGYFPLVVTAETFYAAQNAVKARAAIGRGRRGKHVNLFAGLLRDARNGGTMSYRHKTSTQPIIAPVDALQGRGVAWCSFPARAFESAILGQLAEVTAEDVVGEGGGASRRVEELSGRLKETESLIAAWTAKMDDAAIVDVVAAKLGELAAKRRALVEELAAARREAASPVAESVGGMRTLIDLIKTDGSDDLKLKVRAAIRRIVEMIHLLVIDLDKRKRAAVVLVQFVGAEGRFRLYLIRPGADGCVVDPPSRTWLTNTLDIRTAEGRQRAEKLVKELVKRAEEVPKPAKAPGGVAAPQTD